MQASYFATVHTWKKKLHVVSVGYDYGSTVQGSYFVCNANVTARKKRVVAALL
jgi:hypothetical protein